MIIKILTLLMIAQSITGCEKFRGTSASSNLNMPASSGCDREEILDSILEGTTTGNPKEITISDDIGVGALEGFTGEFVYRGDVLTDGELIVATSIGLEPRIYRADKFEIDWSIDSHINGNEYTPFISATQVKDIAAFYAHQNRKLDEGEYSIVFKIRSNRKKFIDVNKTSEANMLDETLGIDDDYEVLAIGKIPPGKIVGYYTKTKQLEDVTQVVESSYVSLPVSLP